MRRERESRIVYAQRKRQCENTEGVSLWARTRDFTRNQLCSYFDFWTPVSNNYEKMNFCYPSSWYSIRHPEQTNMLIMIFVPTLLLMKILPTSLYYCYYWIQLCNSSFCCKSWPMEASHHWASQWYLMILFSSTFPITVVQGLPCGLSCWITQLAYLPALNICPLEHAQSLSLLILSFNAIFYSTQLWNFYITLKKFFRRHPTTLGTSLEIFTRY